MLMAANLGVQFLIKMFCLLFLAGSAIRIIHLYLW